MARPRTTANAVVIEETVATGRHAYDKKLGSSRRHAMSHQDARPFTASSAETRAQTLRGSAVSRAAQRALTRFNLERGMDEFLPRKLKHPEAFLP